MRILRLIIGILLVASMISFVSAGLYYNAGLDYDKGSIKINSVNVEFSNKELGNYANKDRFLVYSIDVLDSNKRVLKSVFFNVPNKIYYDVYDNEIEQMNDGGEMILNNFSFSIYIPYYENANELVVYDENKREINRRSVGEYSKEKAAIASDKDKESGEDEKSGKESIIVKQLGGSNILIYIIVLIIIIILLIIFFYFKRQKR